MVEAGFFQILIAYTAILVTIVSGIIGLILYYFVPLKVDVATMETKVDNMTEMVEETRTRQDRLITILAEEDELQWTNKTEEIKDD